MDDPVVIVWFAPVSASAPLARRKGRGVALWTAASVLFTPMVLLVPAVLPATEGDGAYL